MLSVCSAVAGCDDPDLVLDTLELEQELGEAAEDVGDHHEWDPGTLAAPPSEPTAKFLSPESGYQYFTWKKGMPPVSMGPTSDKTCLLAGVHGVFGGASDAAQTITQNGEWLVYGQGGVVEVTAVCLSASFVSQTASYSTYSTMDVSSTLDRGCFLGMIWGRFDGKVAGAGFTGAEVTKVNNQWRVRVAGTGGRVFVRCITGTNNTPLKYSSETSWQTGQAAAQLESPLSQPCLLTRLSGNFTTPGDWAGLWIREGIDGVLRQMLGGNGSTAMTGAAGRCIDI